MPIIYSLISRGSNVLAEFTSTTGNFTTITRRILTKIPPQNNKMSYVYDKFTFHYIVDNGIIYMCMCDMQFERRIAFGFLEAIRQRFISAYGDQAKTALAYAMKDFSTELSKQMEYFSNNPNADQIRKVRSEIDEVRNVMESNIDKILERQEKIELLVDKTDNLNRSAHQFRKRSTNLKRSMWWKNCKLWIILVLVAIVVIYMIIGFSCGFDFGCAWKKK
ncbi:putative Vesicle-associated membrane protein 7B [Paratrimastix pyriformis]|uniref:Vesicle-associated membrane protein 7B n=1 Tax=Paratrimastix pyriformis TaxID=342808 RepID=A0ABQ8UK34_9EUKA|nr:putative Vesicle-associated membrane protein 7B [Paratrimastix pyriformis]